MSTISSSKSHISNQGGGHGGYEDGNKGSIFDMDHSENPFALPPDEKIFTFKEEQKHHKMVQRETNKN